MDHWGLYRIAGVWLVLVDYLSSVNTNKSPGNVDDYLLTSQTSLRDKKDKYHHHHQQDMALNWLVNEYV